MIKQIRRNIINNLLEINSIHSFLLFLLFLHIRLNVYSNQVYIVCITIRLNITDNFLLNIIGLLLYIFLQPDQDNTLINSFDNLHKYPFRRNFLNQFLRMFNFLVCRNSSYHNINTHHLSNTLNILKNTLKSSFL